MPFNTRRKFYKRKKRGYKSANASSGMMPYRRTYRRFPKSYSSTSNHYFKRTFVDSISTDGTGKGVIGKVFQFSQIPAVSEFVALFDQYRINCVVVKVVWRSTGIGAIETVNNSQMGAPIMYDVIDLDDGNVPASRQEILEYSKHHVTMFSSVKRTRTLKIYPRNASVLFRTGVSNAYALARKGVWIDMTTTDTEYYGYKAWIDIPGDGSVLANYFDIVYTVYFQCRQAR